MSDEITARLTKVETALDGHLRECNETNRRTEKALDRMQGEFKEFTRDFKSSQARWHERYDEQSTRVQQGFAQAEGARKDLRIGALVAALGVAGWIIAKLLPPGIFG